MSEEGKKSSTLGAPAAKPAGTSLGAPAAKPAGTSLGAPSAKPAAGTSLGAPAAKPAAGSALGAPAAKPAAGSALGAPAAKPAAGSALGAPAAKPVAGTSLGAPSAKLAGTAPGTPAAKPAAEGLDAPSAAPPETAAPAAAAPASGADVPKKKDKDKNKGPSAAQRAAIAARVKKQQEEEERRKEEERRLEQERLRVQKELERQAQLEEQRAEEERRRKVEDRKKREHAAELKRKDDARIAALARLGGARAVEIAEHKVDHPPAAHAVIPGKKRKQPRQVESAAAVAATAAAAADEDVVDDWEALVDDEGAAAPGETATAAAPEVTDTKAAADASAAPAALSKFRCPIVVVLGHVDTGKTKLLDKIRQTNVQLGEAGGITQQIGATYFPREVLEDKTACLKDKLGVRVKVPGLLIIDTPGHESFSNLRSRGSSLCDIAILVVDIMHGLEQQTLESIKLLQSQNVLFVVALNKIDQQYDWRPQRDVDFHSSYALQPPHVKSEFERRVGLVKTAFAEQGINATLYWENNNYDEYVSLVPTSAITGEGISDLLALVTGLSQRMLAPRITRKEELRSTVLEVKAVEGLGTTIDVVLVDGRLAIDDEILVCGFDGPIRTHIRALLTPHPLREMRVKGTYERHKEIYGAIGVKITAQNLDRAVAGGPMFVLKDGDDVPRLERKVQKKLSAVLRNVADHGVTVHASTLGALEALVVFLTDMKIPIGAISIRPVHKLAVSKASVYLEEKGRRPEFATILAFDVKVDRDAQELADKMGLRIFTADIIYHLFDMFTNYLKELKERAKRAVADKVVFPAMLTIIPEHVIHAKNPLILGVRVDKGLLRPGAPIVVPSRKGADGTMLALGRVTSIQNNQVEVPEAVDDDQVAIKIEGMTQVMYGRHFDHTDQLCTNVTREAIEILKEHYREELRERKTLVPLLVEMKKVLGIN
jgi:translation initiation factor aIF-2/yIF-2